MTVLRRRGFRVDSARNGDEALARLALCRYSLLILDLMMPLRSGYDVLEELGRLPAASRPIVLVLTAGAEPRTFDTALVVGTMNKPFDIELLIETTTACLAAVGGQPQRDQCPPSGIAAGNARGDPN